jgi:branched-subunit amino acid aminotransferase/4-amino-4-deoxychorismate lyase
MRDAVTEDHPDAYLRMTVAEPDAGRPRVLTVVRPPVEPDTRPVALLPVMWTRGLPELKHVGTFPQIQLARDAESAGFDDALLVDSVGRISETTVANIAFVRPGEVVWPEGPALDGITQQLLAAAVAQQGITSRRSGVMLADLARFSGAVLVNSIGVTPIGRIGTSEFAASVEAARQLDRVYRQIPAEPL